jgi:TonB family protein
MKTLLMLCCFGIVPLIAQQSEPAGSEGNELLSAAVVQPKTGEVAGTAIDMENRQPLEGVTVEIIDTKMSSRTGKDGQYSFRGIAAGIYQIKASKSGYSAQTENNVRIVGGDKLTVFFGMKKESDIDQQPVPVHHPSPVYPEIMRRAGVQGIIYIQLSVSEKGEVTSAAVQQSRFTGPSGEQLDDKSDFKPMEESALNAARQWKFTPAMKSGKPVSTIIMLPIKFKLDSAKSEGKKEKK